MAFEGDEMALEGDGTALEAVCLKLTNTPRPKPAAGGIFARAVSSKHRAVTAQVRDSTGP